MARQPRGSSDARTATSYARPLTVGRAELLEHDSDQRFRQMLLDLATLEENISTARTHLAGLLGLTTRQYTIFVTVADRQATRDMTVSAIAEHLRISGPFITTETAALVAKGLLEKVPNPRDRRSMIVRLSPRGEALLDESIPELVRINDAMFEPLGADDFQAFSRITAALVASTSTTAAHLTADRTRRR